MLTYPGEALFPPEGSDISESTNALPRAHTAQGDVQHSAPCSVPVSRTTSLLRRAVTLSLMRAKVRTFQPVCAPSWKNLPSHISSASPFVPWW